MYLNSLFYKALTDSLEKKLTLIKNVLCIKIVKINLFLFKSLWIFAISSSTVVKFTKRIQIYFYLIFVFYLFMNTVYK